MLAMSRDLGTISFALAHKMREAMASEVRSHFRCTRHAEATRPAKRLFRW
jgi:hypothetical protein